MSFDLSILAWLTLTLAITWTIAGVILVLLGWLSLPREGSEGDEEEPREQASIGGRVMGGAILATAGTVMAAYLLAGGAGRIETGFQEFARALFSALQSKTQSGFAGASLLSQIAAWLVYWVQIAYALCLRGIAWITQSALWIARDIWAQEPYALVNTIALVATGVVGGFAGWLSSSSRWRMSGVLTYLGMDLMTLGFIGFSILLVEDSTGPLAEGLGLWFLGVEVFGLALFLAYQFYTIEYIAGRHGSDRDIPTTTDPYWTPSVLVQVACYNEPPGIVRETLEAVRHLRYPADRLAVQLVDDSTDPTLVQKLRALCSEFGVTFQHRRNRRGFKGGALNDGLKAHSPPPDLVAIIDADYVVSPEFLVTAVQPFRNPHVGFVQTPQSYRNAEPGTFARWYALADAYFYQVIQPVRAKVQSLIFCGTMGLLRRTALTEAGGWSETCVTEDAELSLRILARGWRGVYLKKPLGWGLAPEQMSAVRSQHRRWAFGGLQMLRLNKDTLAGARLTPRQRRDFLMGGWFWMDGLFLVALTAALAALVVATWFGVHLPLLSGAAVVVFASAPLLFMFDGILKIRIAMRRSTPISYREVLGIMGFWYAIKINDLRAALRGWSGSAMAFVRTPKESETIPSRGAALGSAIRESALETAVATGLFIIAAYTAYLWGALRVGGTKVSLPEWLLLGWTVFYGLVFLSAPLFGYYSLRAERTAPRPPSHQPDQVPSHANAMALGASVQAMRTRFE